MTPKTTFVGKTNPFTGEKKMIVNYADPTNMKITSDALPIRRTMPENKYEPLFKKMEYGQCIVCEPEDVGKVCGAMRKYLSTLPAGGSVKSVLRYPSDKKGRVWMMPCTTA